MKLFRGDIGGRYHRLTQEEFIKKAIETYPSAGECWAVDRLASDAGLKLNDTHYMLASGVFSVINLSYRGDISFFIDQYGYPKYVYTASWHSGEGELHHSGESCSKNRSYSTLGDLLKANFAS